MTRRKFLKATALTTTAIVGGAIGWLKLYNPANYYYRGPISDHFDGMFFFNPNGKTPGKFSDLLKWKLFEKGETWPENWPSPFDGAKPETRVTGRDLKITMVGHACLLIQCEGLNFLTDPVYSDRASPVSFAGPRRVNPPGIRFEDLPPIDYVLLSHNHYDHLDVATLKRLVKTHDPQIICPLGNDTIISASVPQARFIIGDWEEIHALKNNIKIHFEPCHHWSARGAKDRRMALWAAFVLETPNGKIYHVGDTGFHDGINYRAMAEKHGPMRAAILPIGAYEPRWFMRYQHQNPDEAVQGAILCKAQTCIGHHWGTFQLTNEAIDAPEKALKTALDTHGFDESRFLAPRPGETVTIA